MCTCVHVHTKVHTSVTLVVLCGHLFILYACTLSMFDVRITCMHPAGRTRHRTRQLLTGVACDAPHCGFLCDHEPIHERPSALCLRLCGRYCHERPSAFVSATLFSLYRNISHLIYLYSFCLCSAQTCECELPRHWSWIWLCNVMTLQVNIWYNRM